MNPTLQPRARSIALQSVDCLEIAADYLFAAVFRSVTLGYGRFYDDHGKMIGTEGSQVSDDALPQPPPPPPREQDFAPLHIPGHESPEELIRQREAEIARREQVWLLAQQQHQRRARLIAIGSLVLFAILCWLNGLGNRIWFIAPIAAGLAWWVYVKRIGHLTSAMIFLPVCMMTFPVFWLGLQVLCLAMVIGITAQLDADRRNKDMIVSAETHGDPSSE